MHPVRGSVKISNVEGVVQTGQYPNPSSAKRWTDHLGRGWHLRGERGQPLDEKRARRLLRKSGTPLATWSVGEISWFEDPTQKQAMAAQIYQQARCADDVFASEWKSDDGGHLLMLEHNC